MIADNPAKACSDVGKLPLGNSAECQEAASSFGILYAGSLMAGSWINDTKGCYICRNCRNYSQNSVIWSNHETGSERSSFLPICKAIGKYRLRY